MKKSKDFAAELTKFTNLLEGSHQFCLGRYADGEGCIIENMDLAENWLHRQRESATWRHIPGDPACEFFRSLLVEAISYNSPNYYIGIPTPSGHHPAFHHLFERLTQLTTVPQDQLTFARVFHSYNHAAFLNRFMPAATARDHYVICNEKADTSGLPALKARWNVASVDGALKCLPLVDEVLDYVEHFDVNDAVFLIATGPSGGVIAHRLWDSFPCNTYVDIGSALDPILFKDSPCRGETREYLKKIAKGHIYKEPFEWKTNDD